MKGIEYAKKGILLSMTLGMAYGCAEPVDEGGVRGVTDDEIVIGGWARRRDPQRCGARSVGARRPTST